MPITTTETKVDDLTQLFLAYNRLTDAEKLQLRKNFQQYFSTSEKTFYNRLTKDGIVHTSEAEKDWFVKYLGVAKEKLFGPSNGTEVWPL